MIFMDPIGALPLQDDTILSSFVSRLTNTAWIPFPLAFGSKVENDMQG